MPVDDGGGLVIGMTIQEFCEKAEWEGGFEAGIFDYGLRHTDLDTQEGDFYESVKVLSGLAPIIRAHLDVLEGFAEDLDI